MNLLRLRIVLCLPLFIAPAFQASCRSDDDDDSGPAIEDDAPVESPTPEPPPPTVFNAIDESVLLLVPAGEFIMGTSDADVERFKEIFPLRSSSAFDDERPQRTVYVDAFYIDRTEITNAQYRRFLEETGYEARSFMDSPPFDQPDYPALVGAWEDAAAYAGWAGKRLPTEAEWEKAARGVDGRIWPWGDVWDQSILSGNDGTGEQDGYVQMAPVGQFPRSASPYGALDMAGNVWEWTADWYDADYYLYAPSDNPRGPESGDGHAFKGGDWSTSFDFTRCANRQGGNPGSLLVGFRCALDLPGARVD